MDVNPLKNGSGLVGIPWFLAFSTQAGRILP